MPKRDSKSQKIRDYLAANPGATAADVVKALAAQKIRVTPALVYHVKASTGNRRPKPGNYAPLILAKKLVDQLGGVEQARAAVDALARLL